MTRFFRVHNFLSALCISICLTFFFDCSLVSFTVSSAGRAKQLNRFCAASPIDDGSNTPRPPFAVFGYLPEYRLQNFPYESFFREGLTHLIFFSLEVDPVTLNLFPVGERLPREGVEWSAIRALADRYGVKLMVCIGGGGRSAGFARLARDAAQRRRFAEAVRDLLLRRGLDGVDLDWESPRTIEEWRLLGLLLRELRAVLDGPRPVTLSIALHPHPQLGHVLREAGVLPAVDYLHWMAYDHVAPGSSHSPVELARVVLGPAYIGFLRAADPHPETPVRCDRRGKAEAGGLGGGAGRPLLTLGIPFYGRPRGDPRLAPETYAWLAQHPEAAAAYGFSDGADVQAKMRLARDAGLGRGVAGIMIWELGQDLLPPSEQPLSLMRAIGEELRRWGVSRMRRGEEDNVRRDRRGPPVSYPKTSTSAPFFEPSADL